MGAQHRKRRAVNDESVSHRAVAYVRTSTIEQLESLAAQEQRIRHWAASADVEIVDIVRDQASGKRSRPRLQAAVDRACEEGLTLVVTHIDRLARKIATVADVCDRLALAHSRLVVVDNNIDTRTEAGRLAVSMFALMAEIEGQRIATRTAQVVDPKWFAGEYKGSLDVVEAYGAWHQGESMRSIAKRYGISQPSVSRSFKRYEARLARQVAASA
ncbi:recombinase family protein [Ilumatobacter sp.]|nr:recombinase family protein [Ilumatobacter sp.]